MAFSKPLTIKIFICQRLLLLSTLKHPGIASKLVLEMYTRYQDSFLFYQNPQYMQNNSLLLSPPPHYTSHFLTEESRICNPSQPCFMAKQTGPYTQPETFTSSGAPQLPFNYTTDPRTLLPNSTSKLGISGKYVSSFLHLFDRQVSTLMFFSSANSVTT